MKFVYKGTVKDGKLIISNRKLFESDIKQHKEGEELDLTIEKHKKKRSTPQNSYLWGVVYPTALHGFLELGNIGTTIDDVHEFFKDRFLSNGKELTLNNGETFNIAKTTTTLSTTEFMTYVAEIVKFCAEYLGCVVPDPMPLFDDFPTEER